MSKSTNAILASAMLALLAGCGGDGGGSDPAAPGSIAPKTTGDATQATQNTTDASAADASAANAASSQLTGANAITEEGVRAELLAEILITNSHVSFAQHPVFGGRVYPLYFSRKAVQWSGSVPGGTQVQNPTIPGTYSTQQIYSDVDGKTNRGLQLRTWIERNASEPALEGGFKELSISLPMHFDDAKVDRSESGFYTYKADAAANAGDTMLVLGKEVSVKDGKSSPNNDAFSMQAQQNFALRAGTTLPYYKVLQRWESDDGQFTELMLFRGEKAGEVRVCHNTNSTQLKRLACTLWHVPTDWSLGEKPIEKHVNDRGAYIVDDRSMISGQDGLLYWQTPELAEEAGSAGTAAQPTTSQQPASAQVQPGQQGAAQAEATTQAAAQTPQEQAAADQAQAATAQQPAVDMTAAEAEQKPLNDEAADKAAVDAAAQTGQTPVAPPATGGTVGQPAATQPAAEPAPTTDATPAADAAPATDAAPAADAAPATDAAAPAEQPAAEQPAPEATPAPAAEQPATDAAATPQAEQPATTDAAPAEQPAAQPAEQPAEQPAAQPTEQPQPGQENLVK